MPAKRSLEIQESVPVPVRIHAFSHVAVRSGWGLGNRGEVMRAGVPRCGDDCCVGVFPGGMSMSSRGSVGGEEDEQAQALLPAFGSM
jgi:hypothetical protein